MKVEVDVLGSLPLIVRTVSACEHKTTQKWRRTTDFNSCVKVEVDVLDVPNSPYSLCGRKTT